MEPTITISVADYNLLVRKAKQESYNLEKLVDYILTVHIKIWHEKPSLMHLKETKKTSWNT